MQKLKMQTPNKTDENIEEIAKLFPHVMSEKDGKRVVDFDLLRQVLSGDLVEADDEHYRLDWVGKKASLLKANTPITKTLRPCKEDSVDFENTQNLYIEGDNFEVLKLIQESYLNKIKMIYIDPPYNTGKDFVYRDNFTKSKSEHESDIGLRDEDENRLLKNTDSNGRFHSDWLSMMYERLLVSRDLLKEDGVIIVHIDEHEYVNLEKLLNEIFGEDNNLGTIVWDKRNPKGEVAGVAQQHELISIYCKNKNYFKENSKLKRPKENAESILKKASTLISKASEVNEIVRQEFKRWLSKQNFSGGEKAYNLIDDKGRVCQSVSMAAPDKPETRSHRPLIHPITKKLCPVPAKGWRFPDSSMDKLLEKDEIIFGADENSQPRRKYLLEENLYENVSSLLYFGGSDNALSLPFDNPKPVAIASKLIQSVCNDNDMILDFFSGSATTAHAVMQLNAEDGGNRKHICVQLQEATDEKSEAYKAGYKNICEIGKERIRRAGKKILNDKLLMLNEKKNSKLNIQNSKLDLDIGFRVLKIDDTNFKDIYYHPNELGQKDLFDMQSNIKEDRDDLDLLFQTMLDLGVELSLKITPKVVDGTTIYMLENKELVACFANDVSLHVIEEIKILAPYQIVLKDSCFSQDKDKINAVESLSKVSTVSVI